jgi:hypothetical protein
MAACRFRVSSVSVEKNIRGQEMRRLRLIAVAGDAFDAGPLPEGRTPAEPSGDISMLVNESFARKFSLGDEFTVPFMERD